MNRRFRLTSTLAVALMAGTALGGYAFIHRRRRQREPGCQ